jgi:hypothetical protein
VPDPSDRLSCANTARPDRPPRERVHCGRSSRPERLPERIRDVADQLVLVDRSWFG